MKTNRCVPPAAQSHWKQVVKIQMPSPPVGMTILFGVPIDHAAGPRCLYIGYHPELK